MITAIVDDLQLCLTNSPCLNNAFQFLFDYFLIVVLKILAGFVETRDMVI